MAEKKPKEQTSKEERKRIEKTYMSMLEDRLNHIKENVESILQFDHIREKYMKISNIKKAEFIEELASNPLECIVGNVKISYEFSPSQHYMRGLGVKIARRRRELGYSQTELARKLKKLLPGRKPTVEWLSRLENGKLCRYFKQHIVEAFRKVLGDEIPLPPANIP